MAEQQGRAWCSLDVRAVYGAQVEEHDIATSARNGAGIGVLELICWQVRGAETIVLGRDVLNVALSMTAVQESNLAILMVRVVEMDEGTRIPQVLMRIKRLVLVHCKPARTVLERLPHSQHFWTVPAAYSGTGGRFLGA